MRWIRASVLLALLVMATGSSQAEIIAPQSKPWRVGIVGGWTVGYLGHLASRGMPAERILESEIMDARAIKQYDCLIVGDRAHRDARAWQILEDYINDGGTVICESTPIPSATALPGIRLKPGRVPNVQFVDAISPITEGLDYSNIIATASRGGTSIIPEPGSGTTVIARYTYQGISGKLAERVDNHFHESKNGKPGGANDQGSPAILMRHIGKGILVYSGCPMGIDLALRGNNFTTMLINVVRYLSKGEIHDRFYTGEVKRDDLLTAHLENYAPVPQLTEAGAKPSSLPDTYEALEENVAPGEDWWVYGTLGEGTKAEVLLDYRSPEDFRRLSIAANQVTLERIENGKSAILATGQLAEAVTSGADVTLRKRGQLLICSVGGAVALSACPGSEQSGAILALGLDEAGYQPSAPVYFADDFMREEGTQSEWETVSGNWHDVISAGEAATGANPFKYEGTSKDRAIATAGHWFWQDYQFSAAVKSESTAGGLLFYYQDPDNYYVLRMENPRSNEAAGKLKIVRRANGEDAVLAEADIAGQEAQWCTLAVRASGNTLIGSIDGVPILKAADPAAGSGAVGIYSEGGSTTFDDVNVAPWQALYVGDNDRASQWEVRSGSWQNAGDGSVSGIGKAMLPFEATSDCHVQIPVKLGNADAAGVYVRHDDRDGLYLAAIVRNGSGLNVRLFGENGTKSGVLAEKPISGAASQWRTLGVTAEGPLLSVQVDGKTVIQVPDSGSRTGLIGLYARGNQPAQFGTPEAYSLLEVNEAVDQLMPSYAGIIDEHTWAGRPGAWHAQHDNLNRFWHNGYYRSTVTLMSGVHPLGQAETRTHLYLTGDTDVAAGYEVVADRIWSEGHVQVTMLRKGVRIASASVETPANEAYLLSLRRQGTCVWAEVNGKVAVLQPDEKLNPALCRLGVDNEGQPIMAEDLAISTPWARNYTFKTAPTDWHVHSGIWDVTSRWSCTPKWTWFTGMNANGSAEASSKVYFKGDLDLSFYVAARMMPTGDGKSYEQLRDVHIGLCTGPNGTADGYNIRVGGHRNQYTSIERLGKEVMRIPFQIPQVAIHNDWLQLGVSKRGGKITLLYWGQPIMEYTDPEPLDEGGIALGTESNGILIPRLTVYGEVSRPAPDPLGLPTQG